MVKHLVMFGYTDTACSGENLDPFHGTEHSLASSENNHVPLL